MEGLQKSRQFSLYQFHSNFALYYMSCNSSFGKIYSKETLFKMKFSGIGYRLKSQMAHFEELEIFQWAHVSTERGIDIEKLSQREFR